MTRGDFGLKWTAYGVALILVWICNYHILARLPLGAVPQLIPMMAVAVAVLEGPRAGAGFGLAAGLAAAAAAHASPLWGAVLSLGGWVCGLLAQYVLRRDFVGFLPAALAAEALCCGGMVLFRWVRDTADLTVLLRLALPEYLWTVVFAVPVYGLCRFCCRHFGRIYYE